MTKSPEIHETQTHFSNREIDTLKLIVSNVTKDGKGRITEIVIATQLANKEDWKKIEEAAAGKEELRGAKVVIETLEDKAEIAADFRRLAWNAMEAVMTEDSRNRQIEKRKKK